MALDSLHSAEEQTKVAEAGFALAQSEFTQARRRYEAGVASSLEVTDAQTRLERARNNRIAALFNHNVARIDLGQATGTIRAMLERSPDGEQGQPVMTEPKVPETGAVPLPAAVTLEQAAALPPELPIQLPEPRIAGVFAVSLAAPRTVRTVPVHRKAAVRRRTHRRTHRRPVAGKTRPATKAA
jgi:hypothetical protein